MVNHIDIDALTLEELGGVVDIYPWYAGARAEFCRRMSQMGLLTQEQVEQAASSLHQAASTVLDALFGSGSGDASSAENDAA